MYSLTRALMGVLAHLFDSKRHASQRRQTAAGKRASFRPLLEALEDRLTPAQLTVTSAADPAKLTAGTLRYAVNQANVDAAQGISDTIVFQSNLSGAAIHLTKGQLELSGSGQGSIAIDGSSLKSPVTINGAHASRIFQIDAGVDAVLTDLVLTGGSGAGSLLTSRGGAIANAGTLTLDNVTLTGNSAGHGGGIDSTGTLTVNNSRLTGNSASVGGGGICVESGSAVIATSTVSANTAAWGGAIESLGNLTLSQATLSANSASAGGGGLYVFSGAAAVSLSTIAGNSSSQGGGVIFYSGLLSLVNCTISANSASAGGGGLESYPTGVPTLANTIMAGNKSPFAPDVWSTVTAGSSYNLIGNGSGLTGISNGDANHNLVGTGTAPLNPGLAPLANNGGPTLTMALLPGSPALGEGGPIQLTTDQRGQPMASPPDIGAFQDDVPMPVVTALSQTLGPVAGGTTVTVSGANLANAAMVRFGAAAAHILSDSSTKIVAVSPAGPVGTVAVTVTTVYSASPTSPAAQFVYLGTPTILGLSQTQGLPGGGTTVVITGFSLSGVQTVTFGSVDAQIVSDQAGQIVVTAPAQAAGTVDVKVTTIVGSSAATLLDRFSYVPAPTVAAVSPAAGPAMGGTTVTITGANLANARAVYFGLTPATRIVSDSSTQIVVIAPPGASGTVDVTVVTPVATSVTSSADRYSWVANASRTATVILGLLKDPNIRALVQADWSRDGLLTRADMIGLFDEVAQEGKGILTAQELIDLRALVYYGAYLGMPAYVENLAGKVVGYSLANRYFQGQPLLPAGELVPGNTATQLTKLVDKWFLGEDQPAAVDPAGNTYVYAQAAGTLFGPGGPSNLDVDQGDDGDCYFLAGLGDVAVMQPSLLANMIVNNGDGTYSVRFYWYGSGAADWVTVDSELPVNGSGQFVFANSGGLASNTSNVLWVALVEKAYVQWEEEFGKVNSYASISGGYGYVALREITAGASYWGVGVTAATMHALLNWFEAKAGLVMLGSVSSPPSGSNVIGSHEYYLTGYDPATQTFTLVDPWGATLPTYGTLHLTAAQIASAFGQWDLGL